MYGEFRASGICATALSIKCMRATLSNHQQLCGLPPMPPTSFSTAVTRAQAGNN